METNQKLNVSYNHLTKHQKTYNLLLLNRNVVFYNREIGDLYNKFYEDSISYNNIRRELAYLWKNKKIFRSKSQTKRGYYYTLNNYEKLNELYLHYLFPFKSENKDEFIKLILRNSFDKLRTNYNLRIRDLQDLDVFNKYNEKHFNDKSTILFLAKLVAFVMGDGHLSKDLQKTQFFFKEKIDAILFEKEFQKHFYLEKTFIIDGGNHHTFQIFNKSLGKLLFVLGAPIGNKVFQSFIIPPWIYRGPNYIKLAFLSVIYGNEGSKPHNNVWRTQFVLSKNRENLKNLLHFLNQIRSMLNHFGITSSFIQIRKQKNREFNGRFYIKGRENIRKFYNLIGFSYASEKQRKLESLIKKEKPFEVQQCDDTIEHPLT